MSISKKYSPAEIEDKWYAFWESNGFFRSTPDDREPYTIVIPPPNVTGVLHMGHMLNNTIQDVLIRRKRMQGFNALWVPGTDHASIATEAKVVNMLREEKGINKSDISRDEFLGYAFEWKEKYGGIILKQLRKLGASCDWDRTHFTMDEDYYKAVIQVFCDLYDKGHIYRGVRMVNWDPKGQTALSDEEVIHKEVQGKLYYVKYKIKDSDEFVTVATTRPETILGDVAITVNPNDERYTHIVGKTALVPLIDREIPVIADDYVKMDFGTGCLKVTPAHDVNDYEIGIRHKLPVIDTFNDDGTLNEAAQLYVGEDRFEVRKKIVKDIEAAGQIDKIEDYTNSVGYSERTHVPIEPKLSMQWWLNMDELHKPAFENVMNDVVQLVPEKFKNTYRHWMENIRHWCISRQLWWGHRIPAWYYNVQRDFVVAPDAESALAKAKEASGNNDLTIDDLKQDEDVLDTWFSSWLWPIEVFKGMTNPDNPEINYYYPTNDLVTAPEILFFWVARMIIAGYEYKGDKPFNNVYLTGIVRDKQRRKMSKSLGNSPDALKMMEEYGADGVRVGMLLASPAGNDLLFDMSLVEQGRNFANKIWNAFRLVSSWEAEGDALRETEKLAIDWMSARIHEVSGELEDQFTKFRLSEALMTVYRLVWDDFCSWFLEMMKPPFGEKISAPALQSAKQLFEEILMLIHPFMPFLSEEIWQNITERNDGESLMMQQYGEVDKALATSPLLADIEMIKETITAVRAFRAEKNIPNKTPIELHIKTGEQSAFEPYFSLLNKFLNTTDITFTNDTVEGASAIRVRTAEIFIPLAGSVDVGAEIDKIKADIDYTEGFLKSVMKKLGNERFVSNAPAAVVEKEQQKKADAETKLEMLKTSLANLEKSLN